jgi:hypothetical protein
MVPNASTNSLAHALALSAHTRMCVSLLVVPLIFDWIPHCSPSRSWDINTDRPLGLIVLAHEHD